MFQETLPTCTESEISNNQVSSAFQNYANKVSRRLCLVTDLNALRSLIVLYNIIIKFHKQFWGRKR